MHNKCNITDHKSLLNPKVIMDDFSQGGQAVGGAGGIARYRKDDIITTKLSLLS